MKKIIFALVMAFVCVSASYAEPLEVKKVCETTKDAKGKEKQVCKDVKVHKKLEGTPLPEKK
jgi:uncharacterized protein YcfJ